MFGPGPEEELTNLPAKYMQRQHTNVLYHFDLAVALAQYGLGSQAEASEPTSISRFLVAHNRTFDGTVSPRAGLFLELKRKATRLMKKNAD